MWLDRQFVETVERYIWVSVGNVSVLVSDADLWSIELRTTHRELIRLRLLYRGLFNP